MEPDPEVTYEQLPQAAHDVVHAARDEAQAREVSRQAQLDEAIEKTSLRTKADVLDVFQQVFGDGDSKDPHEMKVLVQRIPILCTQITQMHADIGEMRDNQKWATRIVVGLFITAVAKMVFLP